MRVYVDLRFMDVAALGAPQSPMLKAGARRDSALDRHAGLASRTARTVGGGGGDDCRSDMALIPAAII